MHDGLKIAIGAGATALLAIILHAPLGQGAAFVAYSRPLPAMPALENAVLASTSDAAPVDAAPANVVEASASGEPRLAAQSAAIPVPEAAARPAAMVATPSAAYVDAGTGPAGDCQRAVDGAVAGRALSFQSGSAWLNPLTRAVIRDVAAALRQCEGYSLEVAGHTDGTGDEWINRTMSQERANRVRDALVERGVAATAVSARGYGGAQPVRPGDLADAANRRITFTVTEGGD